MPCVHRSSCSRQEAPYVLRLALVLAALASACGTGDEDGGAANVEEESSAVSIDQVGTAWVDFNGDGKADYCRRIGNQNNVSSYLSCTVSTGTGLGATYTSDVQDWGYDVGAAWVDFNGDGKADYCRRVGSGYSTYVSCTVSTGTGFGATYTSLALDWGYNAGVAWVDFNGDRKADYCRRIATVNNSNSQLACTVSTGSGFGPTYTSGVLDWGYDTGAAWVDFNGDGKADYCRRVGSQNNVSSYLRCTASTAPMAIFVDFDRASPLVLYSLPTRPPVPGAGFGPTYTSGVEDWGTDSSPAWVDFNGDRRADYCRRVASDTPWGAVSCTMSA